MRITSMLVLLLVCGCGVNMPETTKDEAMLRELSRIEFEILRECEETNSCIPDLERIDDIKIVRDDRLRQIDPVLRPEFTRKITICHKGHKTMTIEYMSWLLDHRKHGDTRGACLIPELP